MKNRFLTTIFLAALSATLISTSAQAASGKGGTLVGNGDGTQVPIILPDTLTPGDHDTVILEGGQEVSIFCLIYGEQDSTFCRPENKDEKKKFN